MEASQLHSGSVFCVPTARYVEQTAKIHLSIYLMQHEIQNTYKGQTIGLRKVCPLHHRPLVCVSQPELTTAFATCEQNVAGIKSCL